MTNSIPMENPVADYPLIFTLTHDIRASGFLARVVSSGRALMTFEDGEWWCHGVEPGGLAEHGLGPPMAFDAFKTAYSRILQDLASQSQSLEAFVTAVERFMADKDRIEAERWERARAEIRGGKGVEEPFSGLPRDTRELSANVTVGQLRQIEAGQEMVALAEAA